MSEFVDKMDINELRLYAKKLEWLKETQYDLNFISARIEHLFAELTNALLDKSKFAENYKNAVNAANGHLEDMARKYYPSEKLTAEVPIRSMEDTP